MKQKLYALDAFFIEKLKLSENDPIAEHRIYLDLYIYNRIRTYSRSEPNTPFYV